MARTDSVDALEERYGKLPDLAGTYSGTCVLVGDGACAWDDLERLGAKSKELDGSIKYGNAHFLVVNMMGLRFRGEIRHWYSNDHRWLLAMNGARRPEFDKHFWPCPRKLHACQGEVQGIVCWPWDSAGSSGRCAVLTALALGYERVIVCGMPLDNSGHPGDPPWYVGNLRREVADAADTTENHWWRQSRLKVFKDRVRAMSGRTRDWLGAP